MNLFPTNRAQARVAQAASQRAVHEAFRWLHLNAKRILDWQLEMVAIPAPPFGEAARGAWFAERFREIGLADVATDAVGNVTGMLYPADHVAESSGPVVVLSAHLDTVFPAETVLEPRIEGDRVYVPGICDNCAGLAAVLAVGKALVEAQVPLEAPLCLMANVGEEGEGDLRGVRHFYEHSPLAGRVVAHVVLDGAGAEPAVTQALGSRRFVARMTGPGGHSFTDSGTPNPIAALAAALAELGKTPLPDEPRTTMNMGVIAGGTSVNTIPESATASIDFRSTDREQLDRLEDFLRRVLEDATQEANELARRRGRLERGRLNWALEQIGDRPAAALAEDAELLLQLRAVDRHLGLQTEIRLGSTDANLPLSLGVPSFSLGAGGDGGGAHTLAEWYSDRDRELGLKRILLLLLATCGGASCAHCAPIVP